MEKKNNRILIGIILVLCVVVAIGVLFALGIVGFNANAVDDGQSGNNSSDTSAKIKVDEAKDYVYDAQYEANTQYREYGNGDNSNVATTHDGFDTVISNGGKYYLKDLVVPYINIDNPVVTLINNDLKKLYDEYVGIFDEQAKAFNESKTWGSQILKYYTYEYNNILSIVVTYGNQQTDVLYPEYLVYNFDLSNGLLLSYEQFLGKLGYTKDSILKLVEKKVTNIANNESPEHNYVYVDGVKRSTVDVTMETFKNSVSKGNVLVFADSQGNINYIIDVATPAGRGSYPKKITIIK